MPPLVERERLINLAGFFLVMSVRPWARMLTFFFHPYKGNSHATMTTPKHANSPLTERLPERRYLPELHGVRGLALLGVVIFHLFGSGRTSGGIDIFLAVTGFLFTGKVGS